ncbi:MAG: hypothetical protein K8F91_24930 [Candidatus Obscuribacterales bacterium]|nr:hypothetical protein [Candidatus Obscuribacterales bacterium]
MNQNENIPQIKRDSEGEQEVITTGKTVTLELPYNMAAAACYALNGLAPVLWLVTEPKSNKMLRYHSIQALSLFALLVVVNVVLGTVIAIVSWIPVVGSVIGLLLSLIQAVFAFAYLGISVPIIVGVYKGKPGRLPIISQYIDTYLEKE